MQHNRALPEACPGHFVGLCVKNLNRDHLPKRGDIAILSMDSTLKPVSSFTVQAQVVQCVDEYKIGFCPTAFVCTSRSPCKLLSIDWRIGRDTQGAKIANPSSIKAGDLVQLNFKIQKPFVVDLFSNCEKLARVAFMDHNQPVLIGKVVGRCAAP